MENLAEIHKHHISIISYETYLFNQEWMTEDIKTLVYNNGDSIFEAATEQKWNEYSINKKGCYRKLNNGTYVYNGYAVNDKRGILPSGFILPSVLQFNHLINFLGGGDSRSGQATKAMATYPISYEDWVGDQETGSLTYVDVITNGNSKFNAKKGGFVYELGHQTEGECSFWWTASNEGGYAYVIDIGSCSMDLGGGKERYPLGFGFAVRALKMIDNAKIY